MGARTRSILEIESNGFFDSQSMGKYQSAPAATSTVDVNDATKTTAATLYSNTTACRQAAPGMKFEPVDHSAQTKYRLHLTDAPDEATSPIAKPPIVLNPAPDHVVE